MDVEAFLICDAATDQMGKLNIMGAFDAIMAASAPLVHAQFSVAMRIRFKKSESANHPFRINIVDEDGKSILVKPIDGNVGVQIRDSDESAVINLIGNFRDIKFEKFGRYSVDLTMDGKQRGALPLFVRQTPRPA
jgi:hypothetical protein